MIAQGGIPRINHNIAIEIENFLQLLEGEIQKIAHLTGQTFQEPYVGNRGCQCNVAHSFPSHFGLNHFDATFFTDDSPMFHAFVLTTVALVVFCGPKYLGTEQAITLRLESPVINGLRLLDLSIGPFPDFLRRGQRDTNRVETQRIFGPNEKVVQFFHCNLLEQGRPGAPSSLKLRPWDADFHRYSQITIQ